MNINDFTNGINIIQKHYTTNKYPLAAEHDQIYLESTDTPLSNDEFLTLVKLGWFQPNSNFNPDSPSYNPNEGWSAFP